MNLNKGIILLSILSLSLLAPILSLEPVSAAKIYIQNESYYTESLSGQIQSIIDNAKEGDTLEFLGSIYHGLDLSITKNINLLTQVGTTIINFNTTIFTISTAKSSATNISGFNLVTNNSSAIYIKQTNNVQIAQNNITTPNATAIMISESNNITISKNNIYNSKNGVNNSKSKNTNIKENYIHDSENGIVDIQSNNTVIDKNNVSYNSKNGVTTKNCENTSINNNIIIENDQNGLEIDQSSKITIKNNTINGNGNLSKKSGNGIYIKNSKNANIEKNQINQNYNGITTENIEKTIIKNNTINDNDLDGICLNGNTINSTILMNIISENNNGIRINGYNENLTIKGNLINKNKNKKTDTTEYSGDGILFGEKSVASETLLITHNIMVDNSHRDLETRYGETSVYIRGSNWYDKSCTAGCGYQFDPQMRMVLTRTGLDTYTVKFYDGLTGKQITEIAEFNVQFSTDTSSHVVSVLNGVASVTMDVTDLVGQVLVSSYGRTSSLSWSSDVSGNGTNSGEDNGGNKGSGDDNGSGNGAGDGDGSGDGSGSGSDGSGTGTGLTSGSGTSSGTSSSVGKTAATSSASAAGGSNSNGQSDQLKAATEILMDEATKNPQIKAIIALVILGILVLLVYYKKDIQKMMKK